MRNRDVVIGRIGRDVSLLHRVHDRLDVSGAERHVVGRGAGAGRVEGDRGGRRARRGARPQRRVLELEEGLDIEVLPGVVLQRLVDDRGDLMLRERDQLAGVGDRIAGLENGELMLHDRESRLRDRGAFVQAPALRTDVGVNLAVTFNRPSR
jgi:hypothetical protein